VTFAASKKKIPLYQLLGGSSRRIPAYAGGVALGYRALEELLSEIDAALKHGYRALKLRLGDSPERDTERVRAVHQHVGGDIDVLSGVNTAYNLDQITEIMPVLDECQIGWLEEPFPPHDYKSYIAATALGDTPLAAGENHYTGFDFERVLDAGATTVWQPDLSKTGVLPRRCVSPSLRRQAIIRSIRTLLSRTSIWPRRFTFCVRLLIPGILKQISQRLTHSATS
jgi:D-galactarolactone cycloisomerase